MKKSLWTRLLSLLLAVVLCVELLPAVGSAVSPSEDLEHTVEGTVEEPAEVAFEEASLRSERVKHFRMGDGSYVAVQYDVPVHHQDADGQWQDIDNTLEPVGQTYAVEDGSVAFAASLNGDAVFTAGADEHRVQLFLDAEFGGQTIGVHPNDNTATVWMKTQDLIHLLRDYGTEVHVVPVREVD